MLEGQNSTKKVQFCPAFLLCGAICLICPFPASLTVMADGLLTMTLEDEDTGEPVISRMELYRHLPQVSARAQKRLSKKGMRSRQQIEQFQHHRGDTAKVCGA